MSTKNKTQTKSITSEYDKDYFERIAPYENHTGRMRSLRMAIVLEYEKIYGIRPRSVLDVGCGNGYLVDMLCNIKCKLDAYGFDISPYAGRKIPGRIAYGDATKGLPYPAKSFGVVTSSDFFEHLPEETIDFVYSEMKRVGDLVVARICSKDDSHTDSHLTVKPRSWWEEKLKGAIIV